MKLILLTLLCIILPSVTPECWPLCSPDDECFLITKSTVSGKAGDVAYRFYTGDSINQYKEVNIRNVTGIIEDTHFDKSKKTCIVVHGFHQNAEGITIVEIISALLETKKCNLLFLDWSKFAKLDPLTVSMSAQSIGKGSFTDSLKGFSKGGVSSADITLIGFSVGNILIAAGANKIQEDDLHIGSIHALEPPGLWYNIKFLMPLTKKSASMVSVYHTDRGNFGTDVDCGLIDIHFNEDGKRFQPGCPFTLLPLSFCKKNACSHMRSCGYFAEAIVNPTFKARRCDSYDNFKKGKCNENHEITLGMNYEPTDAGKYYLVTNAAPPYGKGEDGSHP
ncbi:pancreatic lipase-related protein 2-like [Periplaneta americana]|uniref:pancreatic lipase-related protein 2-like n=1 Tax=Periplaneta americana TaxID=6978 RepID=UPI0037E7A080